MLSGLFPLGVVCRELETSEIDESTLYPTERGAVQRAVPRRRAEFARGRSCARQALAALGIEPQSIPVGAGRQPVWPAGVTGSITHDDNYCAAVVGPLDVCAALGIDVTRNAPLPGGTVTRVTGPSERRSICALPTSNVAWDRLVFSAKESVYKAWYSLMGTWLGFHDVQVSILPDRAQPERGTFRVEMMPTLLAVDGHPVAEVRGTYSAIGSRLLTGVAIMRPAPDIRYGAMRRKRRGTAGRSDVSGSFARTSQK
jgi:4'-phosphopantetheinyl transferase EntD